MDFNFPVNLYFKKDFTKIGSRLLPEGFYGDRREVQECMTRVSAIITLLGESSAKAQGLQKVITSGDRLRNSDHSVYVLADPEGGSRGQGLILGMLKVGVKHLYLFDSSGNNHEVYANCILDFYVHESMQRKGLGKKLFEHMLKEEQVQPQHMAIDKPSPKLLSFLHKHYGLQTIIPQMNNFVLFEGFFDNRQNGNAAANKHKVIAAGISSSTLRTLSGGLGTHSEQLASPRQQPASPSGVSSPTPFGRPAAHRPVSTMGLILQHQQPAQVASPSSSSRPDATLLTNPEPEDDAGSFLNNECEAKEEVKCEIEEPLAELVIEAEAEAAKEEAAPADVSVAEPELLPCKIQAASGGHLDLKFYHSSLW